ncbi:hypothetical protein [Marisediminicola senii]|uniref:hypothetical protein n=1 Tax=Marisediminicola senii TaxID=2711233 RepID=UPI0013ECF574|nr:hypothetical protein [Marisediminicola senii]
MTTTAIDRPADTGGRVIAVTRLHFANAVNTFVVPWAILGAIFLMNLGIWAIIIGVAATESDRADARAGLSWSGSTGFIFIWMMVLAIQAVTLTFPFALGYSVTRRHFALGTGLALGILALLYGAGLTLLSYIEDWTGGWGLGGRMFTAVYFDDGGLGSRLLSFTGIILFFMATGAAFSAIYMRWRAWGLGAAFVLLTLATGLMITGFTVTSSWPAVGEWLVDAGQTGVVAWSLIPTALCAVLGYLVLSRATP